MALQFSQRLPELLFYTKKSYRILQAPILQGYLSIHIHLHVYSYLSIQRILHPASRIRFYMQKTESSSSTTFQKRNSTHRRQGDLLEIHPCVLQDIPGIPATSPYKGNSSYSSYSNYSRDIPDIPVFPVVPDIPDIPVIHDIPAFQAILQVPVSPGIPPQYSILQLECIFYVFYIFYSSIGFHRKLHRVPVEQLQTFYRHSFFKEREMLRYRSKRVKRLSVKMSR